MYREYFGLNEYPFRLAPDLDYLYLSRGHARAKSYLDYAMVSNDGFVVITGEVGSGKTTLLNNLLAELPEQIQFVHVEHTQLTPTEFLQTVLQRLVGEVETDNKVELLRYLHVFVEQAHARNIRLVIAVDEAQNLTFEVLEEIRMIAGIAAGKEKPISMVLMGQPELARLLETPRMEQFRQRVRLQFHLSGMSPEETRAYVQVRLGVAGASAPEELFGNDAVEPLYEYTGGIPRLINTLCDMALLTAYVDERSCVDASVVRTAAGELDWRPYAERHIDATTEDGAEPPAATSMVPAAQLTRLTDALDRIDGHLGRIARTMEQQQHSSRTWESDVS